MTQFQVSSATPEDKASVAPSGEQVPVDDDDIDETETLEMSQRIWEGVDEEDEDEEEEEEKDENMDKSSGYDWIHFKTSSKLSK